MLAVTVRLICADLMSDAEAQRFGAALEAARLEHVRVRRVGREIELVLFLQVAGEVPYTMTGSGHGSEWPAQSADNGPAPSAE